MIYTVLKNTGSDRLIEMNWIIIIILIAGIHGGMMCHAGGFTAEAKGKWWQSEQVGYDNKYPNYLTRSFRETIFEPLMEQLLQTMRANMHEVQISRRIDVAFGVILALFVTMVTYLQVQQRRQMIALRIEQKEGHQRQSRLVNARD